MYYFDDKWATGVGQAIWPPTAGHNSLFFKGLPLQEGSGGTTVATGIEYLDGKSSHKGAKFDERSMTKATGRLEGDRFGIPKILRVFAKATSFTRRRQVFRPPFGFCLAGCSVDERVRAPRAQPSDVSRRRTSSARHTSAPTTGVNLSNRPCDWLAEESGCLTLYSWRRNR